MISMHAKAIQYVFLLLAAMLSACRDPAPPPASSFYYWKTVFQLRPSEREALTANGVERLYIRYFDVVRRRDHPGNRPEATVVFRDGIPRGMEAVPAVFIMNDALAESPADSMESLAAHIYARIGMVNRMYGIADIAEIQMDCDWNASTRDRYFALLQSMRAMLQRDGLQLSATLRLHQFKYRKTTGTPPVDRVTLMCYNMGRLTEYGSRNSILNITDAQDYIRGTDIYPVPVDIALPLFGWGVCFDSNQKYRGLISGLCAEEMQQPYFTEIAPGIYRADSAVVLRGSCIRKGDRIRPEEPSIDEIRQVARLAASRIKRSKYVIWYHLDSLLLQKHPDHELQKTVDLFR
ncbi:MAG: hypothetical protein LBL04_06895 [Bacteroidales bacterium]|nr:hypothetical protein [Bacteroidales bacterium]